MRIVVAPDKFRGTATAGEATAAIAAACRREGHDVVEIPMADGGEGTLDVLGGATTSSTVTGPLGDPVECAWRLKDGLAVVETARACGLLLAGGAEHNDPVAASTFGVGEVLDQAIGRGARRIVVGVGGSATTDGGLGAISALGSPHRFRGITVEVGCDVTTRFVEAAEEFAPQKGASPAQVQWLRARLEQLVGRYREAYGADIAELRGAGAAGGLAGGLAVLGARLVPGFDIVADEVGLADAIFGADLVITGEGHLDATSGHGKVVGGMRELCHEAGVSLAVVAGDIDRHAWPVDIAIPTVSLRERFGLAAAMTDTLDRLGEATRMLLEATRRRVSS